MAKRTKQSRHGRSGDPRKRAAQAEQSRAAATPELAEEVAAALELGHPIDLVMLASALITSVDPDLPGTGPVELPPVDAFVRMFLDSPDPDLMILGWVVAQLLPDARLQVEADLALGIGTLPDWLEPLPIAEVVSAWQTTDPLYDSTDIIVSLRIGEADLSVIGLIDRNTDGAVKDAFAVPVPLAAVQEALSARGRPGMQTRDLDPAEARAWLTEAIAAGRDLVPPFESDTWPQIRPLLEWALRRCPPDGQGRDRQVWRPGAIAELVAEFAASAAGEVVADEQDQAVLVSALHAVTQQTSGDPLLLSPTKLELGLGYLWPTALHFELDRLLNLPDMLGPYVRWAHARRGIPADHTEETLAALAHRRAEYVRDVCAALEPGDDHG